MFNINTLICSFLAGWLYFLKWAGPLGICADWEDACLFCTVCCLCYIQIPIF